MPTWVPNRNFHTAACYINILSNQGRAKTVAVFLPTSHADSSSRLRCDSMGGSLPEFLRYNNPCDRQAQYMIANTPLGRAY